MSATRQQRHVLAQSERTDSHAFFNLLTGAQLFDDVEALLPEHRERLFPPTAPSWWLWRNRRLRLVDGATVTLGDTDANQKDYPQLASHREGLGFPMMRMVGLICLAGGALLDAATGARKRSTDFRTGERLGARDHLIVWTHTVHRSRAASMKGDSHHLAMQGH